MSGVAEPIEFCGLRGLCRTLLPLQTHSPLPVPLTSQPGAAVPAGRLSAHPAGRFRRRRPRAAASTGSPRPWADPFSSEEFLAALAPFRWFGCGCFAVLGGPFRSFPFLSFPPLLLTHLYRRSVRPPQESFRRCTSGTSDPVRRTAVLTARDAGAGMFERFSSAGCPRTSSSRVGVSVPGRAGERPHATLYLPIARSTWPGRGQDDVKRCPEHLAGEGEVAERICEMM